MVAKNISYERWYERLDSNEGGNEVFKFAKARKRTTRDLGSMRCIKEEDGKVLINDTKVQERLQSYFYKLFNGVGFDGVQDSEPKG